MWILADPIPPQLAYTTHSARRPSVTTIGNRTTTAGAGQEGRGPAEVAGESGDLLHIRALRRRRQIPNLHVFEHPLAKRGHGGLLGSRPGAFQACGRSVCEAGDQISGENRWAKPEARVMLESSTYPFTAKRFSPTDLMLTTGRAKAIQPCLNALLLARA